MIISKETKLLNTKKGLVDIDRCGMYYLNDANKTRKTFPYSEVEFKGKEFTIKAKGEYKLLAGVSLMTARGFVPLEELVVGDIIMVYKLVDREWQTHFVKMYEEIVTEVSSAEKSTTAIKTTLNTLIANSLYIKE